MGAPFHYMKLHRVGFVLAVVLIVGGFALTIPQETTWVDLGEGLSAESITHPYRAYAILMTLAGIVVAVVAVVAWWKLDGGRADGASEPPLTGP